MPTATQRDTIVNSTAPGGQGAVIGLSNGQSAVAGQIRVGQTAAGLLTIQNNSTLTVGGGGGFGFMIVGYQNGAAGTLVMQSGGKLVTADIVRLGEFAGSSGTVTMSGTGTTWTANGNADFSIGYVNTGTLNLNTGASIVRSSTSAGVTVGAQSGSNGTLNFGGGTLQAVWLRKGNGAGQVNFNGGTLRAIANETNFVSGFASGQLALQAGGLTIDTQTFAVTAASPFSGTGGLTVTGTSGTLTLSTANTFSGGLTVNGGTVTAGSATAFGATTGTLTVNGGTANFNNNSMTFAGLAGTGGTVSLGSGTLTLNQAGNSSYAGAVTGTGGLVKGGAGSLTLSGNNSFSGGLTVNAGTVTSGSATAFGATTNTLTVSGGTVNVNNSMTLAGLTGTGTVSLGSATLTLNQAGNSTYSGTVTGAGALAKGGAGNLTLSGGNSFSGGLTVNAGTVTAGANNALGAGTLAVAQNATAAVGTTQQTVTGLSGLGTVSLGNAGVLTVNQATATNSSFGGAISGTGGFTKAGAGTLTLTGASSFSGQLNVNQGTLALGSGGSVAAGETQVGSNVNSANGTLNITGASTLTTTGRAVVGGLQSPANSGTGTVLVDGANSQWTVSGGLFLGYQGASGTPSQGTLTVSNGGVVTVGGAIAVGDLNNATGTLNVQSGGQLTTDAANVGNFTSGANGQATVTGAGSRWTINGTAGLNVGRTGTGRLDITSNGTVTVTGGGATIGTSATGSGTLNVNSGGVLETQSLTSGAGTKQVTFDGGTLRATASDNPPTTTFVSGFTGNQLAIGAGGLTIDTQTFNVTSSAVLSNATGVNGALNKIGSGTLTLSGASTFTGGLNVNAGTVSAGANNVFGAGALAVAQNATANVGTTQQAVTGLSGLGTVSLGSAGVLTVNQASATTSTFGGVISGTGAFTKDGAGTVTLTGANSYTGATSVSAGTLVIEGNQSAATGATGVASGATLTGSGTLGGDVTIASGGILLSQNSAANPTYALTINGNLDLQSGSFLNYVYGTGTNPANAPDGLMIDVTGNVTLAGTLNVTNNGAAFTPGVYGLLRYAGTLDATNLTQGTIPTGAILQTGVPNRVDLLFTGGAAYGFWNGAGNGSLVGGDGTWTADQSGDRSWTDGINNNVNGPYAQGGLAIFSATAGTVTVDNTAGAINVGRMQFLTDGYVIGNAVNNGTLTLTPMSGNTVSIIVGDQSGSGTPITATINSVIAGTGVTLVKEDIGTLILTGTNTYDGGTRIVDGTIQISADANLGGAPTTTGGLTLAGGTLQTTATMPTSRAVTVEAAGGTLSPNAGTTLTMNGQISGAGVLTKAGDGNLVLAADNSGLTGGLMVTAGTATAGTATAFGANTAVLTVNGGTAEFNGQSMTLGGLTGTGGTVSLGTIATGAAALELAQTTTSTYAGNITGIGSLEMNGAGGNLTLSGNNSFTGGLTVTLGTVTAGSTTAFGATTNTLTVNGGTADLNGQSMTLGELTGTGGTVSLGTAATGASTLTLAQTTTSSYAGSITGIGTLEMDGAGGSLTLSGSNTGWSGGLTVTDGTVTAASTSAFGSGVLTVNGTGSRAELNDNSMTLAGLASTSTGGTVDLGTSASTTLTLNPAGSTSYTGNITGSGGIEMNGAGNQTLSGNNTYTGGTTVTAGTLTAGSATAFGATTGTLTVNGGTAALNGQSMTLGELTGTGGTVSLGSATLTLNQTVTSSYAGVVAGSGTLSMNGAGSLTLSGANTFTGGLTLTANAGTVTAGSTTAFGSGVLTVEGGTADLADNSMTLAGLASTGTGGTINLGTAASTVLTLDPTTSTSYAGAITGSGGVEMNGTGNQTLAGDNDYAGGTTVTAGTLTAGGTTAFGAAIGLLTVNGGTASLGANSMTLGGLTGSGGIVNLGTAILTLDQTSTGVGDTTYAGNFTGTTGGLTKQGDATLTLTGTSSSYSGPTNVTGGMLVIDQVGSLTSGMTTIGGGADAATMQVHGTLTAPVTVAGNGTLSGEGTIAGSSSNVLIQSGGRLWTYDNNNDGIQKLTMGGNLTLNAGGTMQYNYGVPPSPSADPEVLMVQVAGDVTLNGTIQVNADPIVNFDPGVYGLVHYSGTSPNLTGLQFDFSSLTNASDFQGQTAVPGRINFVYVPAGMTLNYWYGDQTYQQGNLKGGTGTWSLANNNWTDENATTSTALAFANGSMPIFSGQSGTVTVDNTNGQISITGMQFTTDGYVVSGATPTDAITLTNGVTGTALIVTGDNSANSGNVETQINVILQGSARLEKDDLGTLELTGTNTYTGGTLIDDGTLRISRDANLGASLTDVTLDGGTLQNTDATNPLSTARPIFLGIGGGTFLTQDTSLTPNPTTLTLSGVIADEASGGGPLIKDGVGTLILTGANTYTAGTTISAGTLQVGVGGANGTIGTGDVVNDGALVFNRDNTSLLSVPGAISGSGTVTQAGGGTTILSGANSYTGGTTINAGTLQVSSDDNLGDPVGGLTFGGSGGTLQTVTNPVTSDRAVTLNATGTFKTDSNLTLSANITGAGGLTKTSTGTLTLSGASTYSGTTTVQQGTLSLANGSLQSAVAVQGGTLAGTGTVNGAVTNELGKIAPGDGGASGTLTFTNGYTGNFGTLVIRSQLGTDTSPTSSLTLAGGAASGNTTVQVNNAGGTGAQTTGDGIPVVVASGATTTTTAFLMTTPAIAGSYQYKLFRGPAQGGTNDQLNSWYLRSSVRGAPQTFAVRAARAMSTGLLAASAADTTAAGAALASGATPAASTTLAAEATVAGEAPAAAEVTAGETRDLPIYREEAPMYSAMPGMARELARSTIGSFHDYNGDQGLVRGNGAPSGAWVRAFGQGTKTSYSGPLGASFDGHSWGLQTGVDLFQGQNADGFNDRFGIFMAYAESKGDVNGFALGNFNAFTGTPNLQAVSLGGYWTRVAPSGWYIDMRVMGTHYSGEGASVTNDIGIKTKGEGFTASVEGGYPIPVGLGLTIEPQLQLIYSYTHLSGHDPYGKITYDLPDALYGRLGARLAADNFLGNRTVRPFVKASVWQDFTGTDQTIFNGGNWLDSRQRLTAVEVGGGITAQINQYVGAWANVDYTTDVGGDHGSREVIRGNLGLRVTW